MYNRRYTVTAVLAAAGALAVTLPAHSPAGARQDSTSRPAPHSAGGSLEPSGGISAAEGSRTALLSSPASPDSGVDPGAPGPAASQTPGSATGTDTSIALPPVPPGGAVAPGREKDAAASPASPPQKPSPDGAALDALLAHGWSQALYQNHKPRLQNEEIDGPYIALTFDDGPKLRGTDAILDDLNRYKAHATFFLVGKMCARYPDIVARIAADGNEIGNHTYDHYRLPTIPIRNVAPELERNRALIRQITGQTTYLFRPPGGRIDPRVQTIVDSLGYTTVFWRLDSGELSSKMDPDKVYHRVVDNARDGDIVLLHNGDPNILQALPQILDNLSQRGFQFVTVSELTQLTGARPVDTPVVTGIDTE